jgi:hypothetical protein
MSLTVDPTSTDLVTPTYAHETPAHQANIRSYFKLRPNLSLDVTGRFADGLPTQHVEQYVTADVRVDWHSNDLVHFTFTGRNLANRKHQEFISSSTSTLPTGIERSFFVVMTLKIDR